jgi:NADPH:quinone reductase-like Zn-dependent oxidoreductase
VLIAVDAVGLVASDWRVRGGSRVDRQEHHFPAILGFDFAGRVAEADGDDQWRPGRRVFGIAYKPFVGAGCLAELVAMPLDGPVVPTPDSLSDVEAAALVSGWLTSLAVLDEITVGSGDLVAVVGASGGVGSVLVQLLARRGARVVAVTRSDNEGYVRSLGAEHVVCRDRGDVAVQIKAAWPDGIDTLVDLVSEGNRFREMADVVRQGGQATSAVAAADPELSPRKDITFSNVRTRPSADRLTQLAETWFEQKLLMPEIRPISLDEVAEAIDLLERGQRRGKFVVTLR